MVRITIDVEEHGRVTGLPPTAIAQSAAGALDGGAAPVAPIAQVPTWAPGAGVESTVDAGSPPQGLFEEVQQASGPTVPLAEAPAAEVIDGGAAPGE